MFRLGGILREKASLSRNGGIFISAAVLSRTVIVIEGERAVILVNNPEHPTQPYAVLHQEGGEGGTTDGGSPRSKQETGRMENVRNLTAFWCEKATGKSKSA